MNLPPCTRYSPGLFDSTVPGDHLSARAVCAVCPMVRACLERAIGIAGEHEGESARGPDGTWGGLLWKCGHIERVEDLLWTEVAA